MRITFALPELSAMTGGLRIVAQYAEHLVTEGHQVTLAVRRPDRIFGRRQRFLNRIGFEKPYPPLSSEQGYFGRLGLRVIHLDENRVLQAHDLPDADVVISTWWTTAEWADSLPPSKGRHIHFIQGYEDFNSALTDRVQAVYNNSSSKIVVAGWLRDILRERHRQSSLLVMNGVDTVQFSAPRREKAEQSCIGMLWSEHPLKNCALGLNTMIGLRSLRPNIRAIIFGSGPRPDILPDWIPYEQRPSQARISEIYAVCDLWLFPSQSEGFGLPLLEAMSCGTPVLATPAGAAPDLIEHGRNGKLLPSDVNAETMAAEAHAFLNLSDPEWKVASDAAIETARQHSLRQASRQFEEAVVQILERNSA